MLENDSFFPKLLAVALHALKIGGGLFWGQHKCGGVKTQDIAVLL